MTQLPADAILELLREGEMALLGLLPDASNYTFVATVAHGDLKAAAVYKPQRGEIPLWDFPDGTLYRREVAAFIVSEALGWGLVPPTVVREGPEGIGSVQLYIDHDQADHYLTLMPARADVFKRVCALDVLINNADRKSGHCLLERDTGRIFVVDHGVCFHEDPKLRTVIWEFAGDPVPTDIIDALRALDVSVAFPFLSDDEIEAMTQRRDALVATSAFPDPPQDRRPYPWPPV